MFHIAQQKPMTSIEDTTASLSEVDFPSVTICNVNQVPSDLICMKLSIADSGFLFLNILSQLKYLSLKAFSIYCIFQTFRPFILILRCSYQFWKRLALRGEMMINYQLWKILFYLSVTVLVSWLLHVDCCVEHCPCNVYSHSLVMIDY